MNALPKDLPARIVRQNPTYAMILQAMEQRKLNAPMPPEDFESLLSDRKNAGSRKEK
jgi:hypothetical protein